jgi:hypothetical protein
MKRQVVKLVVEKLVLTVDYAEIMGPDVIMRFKGVFGKMDGQVFPCTEVSIHLVIENRTTKVIIRGDKVLHYEWYGGYVEITDLQGIDVKPLIFRSEQKATYPGFTVLYADTADQIAVISN